MTHATSALRAAHLAGARRARRARRRRRRDPDGHARGSRPPPADRHRRAPDRGGRARGLRARQCRRRNGAPVPDRGARLHAAPPALPGLRDAALERLRGVPARPRPLALPPRLRPHPDGQRARLQPAARRHRGAARQRGAPRRDLRLVLVPRHARVQAAARGAARVGPWRHGARLRARDLALPRHRARTRADGARGQGDPAADGVHVDGLERRPALLHAALERALAVRRDRRRDARDGREGRRWLARAQDEIAQFICEVRDRAHPQPVDHH